MSARKLRRVGVLDFFCGCGGTSAGFKNAQVPGVDVRIIAGIDFDPHACRTFERNIGAPAECLDISKLADDEEALSSAVARWRLEDYDDVIFVGCAPCQGFAAHRLSMRTTDARRNLFVEFCRLAARLNPTAIFMENVPELFSKQHWSHFAAGRQALADAGFHVRARVFNFAEFGLPQERFRAVAVAARRPLAMPMPLLQTGSFKTVRDAIGMLPRLRVGGVDPNDSMHVVSRHRASTVALLSKVPKDGGNRPVGVGPKCLDRARETFGGYTDVYGRLAWDRPSVTITARCRTPSCGRFAHPTQNRGLSVREAALLQGFPKTYYFEGPFDDKYKQIGNAVPPIVARVFARQLLKSITGTVPPATKEDGDSDVDGPLGPGFSVLINGIKRRARRDARP